MEYLLALLGAAAFFVFFSGYFSFYILVLTLVFPLFSLCISLPGMLGDSIALSPSSATLRRGDTAEVTLRRQSRWRLPVGQLSARFHCENLLTGEGMTFRRKAPGGAFGFGLGGEVACPHCGVVVCRVTGLKVCDMLGLFALKRPLPPAVSILVLPLELPPEPVKLLLGDETRDLGRTVRPGGGPGEDYDLRPYRPGDPLRSVHWKLSAKMGDLVVRETLEPIRTTAVLTFDLFGDFHLLDGVFDRLDAISRGLLERERPHSICWANPETGAVCRFFIGCVADLRACQGAIFSTPAPKTGRSLSAVPRAAAERGVVVRAFHVTLPPSPAGGDTA